MSSDSPSTNAPGTLVVEVPHWAAVIEVSDSLSQAVAGIGTPTDAGNGLFKVTASLKAGVYNVDVALGTSSDNEWVSVRPGKVITIPASRWSSLQLASAAPLQARNGGLGQHAAAAEEWSRRTTWETAGAGHSRLFIFVRTPDVAKYPSFSDGLTLLDAAGKPLTTLGTGSTKKDAAAGWMAFGAGLGTGSYILSRNGPGPWTYSQPIYLCDGWETHVFIVGGKGPSFRALTVHMAPYGAGFRHDDDTAAASEAVLSALLRGDQMRNVVCSKQLNQLLRREQKNPWLAVLAVHGMLAVEEEWRRDGIDPATVIDFDPTLKHEVVTFLDSAIGAHPDVRALSLKDDAPAQQPFDFPPMLRAGLRRVQQHSTKFADTIPVGSLTDRMLDRLITSSAWSVWRQSVEAARQAEPSQTEKKKSPDVKNKARRRLATAVLRSALNPSAPIFAAPRPTGTPPPGASDVGRVLYDLPLIKAAQAMIGERGTLLSDKIVVDQNAEASKLFEQVDPKAFSAASGIPLGRAERAVSKLRRLTEKGTSLPGDAGPTLRAAVEFAVRQSSRNLRPGGTPAQRAKEVLEPAPEKIGRLTFEEAAETLHSAAVQMTSVDPSQREVADIPRAAHTAERLQAVARVLLGHADLIAITGPDGQFVYGNGAFTMLLSLIDPDQPVRAGRRWCRWLSSLPVGRNTNLRSPVDAADRRWTVHRVAVEYAGSSTISAYVNILDDEGTADVPSDAFDRIAAAVSEVSLHASFVQYGSSRRRAASLEALEEIAGRLEEGLVSAHHGPQGPARDQMPMTKFDAPGFLEDWNAAAATRWSQWISDRLDEARDRDGANEGLVGYGPRKQFFNPLRTPPTPDAVDKDVEWTAFPRLVQLQSISDRQRWRTADSSRSVQDEYCEWSVTRDPTTDKIVRVTFTSEGPEYWQFLAAIAPDTVLALFQKHISPNVKRDDLFRNGRYVPENRWNNSTTMGAMHLIQASNTLGAEIELAAAATIVRKRNGALLTEAQELIACGRYGQPERHSDPLIGAVVNELARANADITLKNPVGLYIAGLSVAGWETPDGSDPLSYWTITRGTKEKALRAVYEVPAGKGFAVGDIKINGRAIEFGAQIADFIRIKLTGTATRIGQSTVAPFDTCVTRAAVGEAVDVSALSVEDALTPQVFGRFR